MVSDEGHHLKVELFEALAGFLTIFIAIALVVGVVFVFLQNWRATIIPVVAIPISLVGTFPVLAAFGASINNLSLFGLVLAVGIVVRSTTTSKDCWKLRSTNSAAARAYSRVLKVGRTIADLVGSDDILASHIAEGIR